MEVDDCNKRGRGDMVLRPSHSFHKKQRIVANAGFCYLKSFDVSPILSSTSFIYNSICLRSDWLYTIGRNNRCCEIVFEDARISKRHCQIFFDGLLQKIFIVDGFFMPCSRDLDDIRRRFRCCLEGRETKEGFSVRGSLNGVFVNGFRLGKGSVMELSVGDEVSFACRNEFNCSPGIRIRFVVERVIFTEEVPRLNGITVDRQLIGEAETIAGCSVGQAVHGEGSENVLGLGENDVSKHLALCRSGYDDVTGRAVFLLSQCRQMLDSLDPINYIQGSVFLNSIHKNGNQAISREKKSQGVTSNDIVKVKLVKNGRPGFVREPSPCCVLDAGRLSVVKRSLVGEAVFASETNPSPASNCAFDDKEKHANETSVVKAVSSGEFKSLVPNSTRKGHQDNSGFKLKNNRTFDCSSSGGTFCLNRLEFMEHRSLAQHSVISLPELLYPIESLLRIFIATFTSDISWFLSYCEVPNHLPITIACHNTERCWNSNPDKRISVPYSDFPNLVVVNPPFPEVIAFGRNQDKRQGIGCHHPKLLVLQREDSIRVVVTSANLVSKQWSSVTNTVWWQDFPSRNAPDYSSLFTHPSDGETLQDLNSDFASQLAGFMASLVVDAPSQAYWIIELTKYDFGGAVGHLVVSIPGMHLQKTHPSECMHVLSAICASRSSGMKFFGSIETSVVGLNHRFHTAADSEGVQLKMLASFLSKCSENAYGLSEVVLRRNTNIPADVNAISVLISDLDEFSEGDYIQLGFLPRDVAKWVAPLCDAGLFSFSACICRKEALKAALEGRNDKVLMILYVSQGPNFSEIQKVMKPEHVPAICSLVASVQRCFGLWRLQEVLGRYKWPESLETDFVYGSSSIGTSVNANFLAAFSAAAGKRSFQFSESEESDPEWGCWNASQELRSPSMRIVFPTIERVKGSSCGIWPSRHVLCFSERTWQRLRNVGIFHDAIPHPSERIGYPMHIKVARRRFQRTTDGASFGWVYCGSHNFSPAAWGRPMCNTSGLKADEAAGATCALGSKLHICNYELGIIFIIPPLDKINGTNHKTSSVDDIILPFIMPPPKYQPEDRPATGQAMKEALLELAKLEKEKLTAKVNIEDLMDEEFPDEEEEEGNTVEVMHYVVEEKEEENAYARTLWSQVESTQN
ncbi:PREDICTED: uncharacterized protein LOC104592681 isoform X2 [Nelumbo nucifera]|uniref:Uncharacterized protein LOC104592681 isoform X2 n=2 Tax=Nelumbo nucifera TaxID=4432 RepID=A0A1U7ZQI3_NELNU|nr:PREDICTED: uncharacterized protein LOC104592681 isoform X2 [Nelumbo nucifera]DAD34023.1 TPA_asm: hypothetical protein HUJ06_004663 [Nelumbo nucifera]